MDRLQTLEIFVAVAEAESFSGGARTVGISAPSATRGINALEARLGTRLFTRTTRRVRLTDVGAAYLDDTKRILADLQVAEDAATGTATNPVGQLRITCSNEFGRLYVMPILMEYLDHHADMTAEIVMLDRVANMVEEGFDIAVRIGELPSSGLSAVKVGSVRRVVCGSPEYFDRHGKPQSIEDLKAHQIILISPTSPTNEWRFGRNLEDLVKIQPRVVVSSVPAGITAARQGWGITRVLSYQIGTDLAAGSLQTILTDYEPEPWPVHLVHTEGRRAVAKVRTFIDFASDRLRRLEVFS